MANLDPIAEAGHFIRFMKDGEAQVDILAAATTVTVPQLYAMVEGVLTNIGAAESIINRLLETYSAPELRDRLAERLAIPPSDIVADYQAVLTTRNTFRTTYANLFPMIPNAQTFDPNTGRHPANTVDVSAAGGFVTAINNLSAALQPFAD